MSRESFERYIPEVDKEPNVKRIVIVGVLLVGLFFGGLILWSAVTRIDAAAMAPGVIVVEGKRQSVQHLEGGIIKKILVADGSKVKKGDTLIQLETTQSKISLELMQNQIYEVLAMMARLEAEKKDVASLNFPARLLAEKKRPAVKELMQSQKQIFETNKKAYLGQLKILSFKIKQLAEEINSFNAQLVSVKEQQKLIAQELKAVRYLADKKLVELPRLLGLQREQARLAGNKGEFLGLIAKSKQKIAETKSQMITMEQEKQKQTLKEFRQAKRHLSELLEKEKSASDVLKRATIIAPASGVIVGLQKHTESGVISPSQQILDIVPSEAELVVEAKISPMDIDVVQPGLKAKLQFTAFKQRNTPSLDGIVSVVSADILQDEATGQQYYSVKIKGFAKAMEKLKHIELYPGMPVQVMIITDNRSPLSYLLGPVKDSLNRAFRES